ncbi:hypothetical protein V8G61_07655 [Gaetbulibacter sp. M240]|uniref:hypothetical protein n=1 Tax=Gaetbulibacter sp. M240 TaxID=3126511 RepID=UPI00374FA917
MKSIIFFLSLIMACTISFGQNLKLKNRTATVKTNIQTLNTENQNQDQTPIIAYGHKGEAIILYSNKTYNANDKVPKELKEVLFEYLQGGHHITDIEFTPQGGWVIATNRSIFVRNVQGQLLDKATKTYQSGNHVIDVEFNPDNWDKERGFVYLDNTMALVSSSTKTINFNRTVAIPRPQHGTTENAKSNASKVTYRFRFDWLGVFEANDRGIPGGKLDLYGHCDLELWFTTPDEDKIKLRLDKNLEFTNGTSSRFKGELFRIDRDKAVELGKGEGMSLAENEAFVHIDLNDFGGISLEDFEKNAYLRFSVHIKESDTDPNPIRVFNEEVSDDEFPAVRKSLYLIDAPIDPIISLRGFFSGNRGNNGINRENVIRTNHKKDEIGLSFSLNREVE